VGAEVVRARIRAGMSNGCLKIAFGMRPETLRIRDLWERWSAVRCDQIAKTPAFGRGPRFA